MLCWWQLMKTYYCSKNCSICEHCSAEPASYWKATATSEGREVQAVEYCQSGWPSRQSLAGVMKHYHTKDLGPRRMIDESRVVIPSALRLEMLNQIHTEHQGISKCHKQPLWSWGLTWQLEKCSTRWKCLNQRREPFISTALPELLWQQVGTDLFEFQGHSIC